MAREITYNNFEISLVVFMPNITTDHAITYTNWLANFCATNIKLNDRERGIRCFRYTVFQRPYRYFSIAFKVIFSFSDRYKIFTSNWLWLEICENAVLSKIDITMRTLNKNFEIDKAEFSQWVPPNKTLKKHQILDLTFG